MDEYIKRQDALDVLNDDEVVETTHVRGRRLIKEKLRAVPTADVKPVVQGERIEDVLYINDDGDLEGK